MFFSVAWILILIFVARALWSKRNAFGLKKVEGLLSQAVLENVISIDQKNAILKLATGTKKRRMTAATSIAIFGGLFVLAGISLIIAHNWEQIGPWTRVIGYNVLLFCLAFVYIRYRHLAVTVRMILELLWFVFPLLGIGLYAQTFQLSGDPIRPFVVWLALSLLLAYASDYFFIKVIYLISILCTLFVGNFGVNGMLSLLHGQMLPWVYSGALIFVGIYFHSTFMPKTHRWYILGVLLAWAYSLFLAATPFEIHSGMWLEVAAVAFATLYVTIPLYFGSGTLSELTGGLAWISSVYAMTFFWHSSSHTSQLISYEWERAKAPGMIFVIGSVALAALSILPVSLRRYFSNRKFEQAAKLILMLTLVASLGLMSEKTKIVHAVAFFANILLVATALLYIFMGSQLGEASSVYTGMAILLLVLVTRFFDIFGTYLQSGIGFVIAGLFLGGLAYLVEKGRKKLIRGQEGAK